MKTENVSIECVRVRADGGVTLGKAVADAVHICLTEYIPVVLVHNDSEYHFDPNELVPYLTKAEMRKK